MIPVKERKIKFVATVDMLTFNVLHGFLSFIFVCSHIVKADTPFLNLNFKEILSDTKAWISDFVSEINFRVLPFNSLTGLYFKTLNRFMFASDDVVTSAYDNFKSVIHVSDDLLSRFTGNISLWHKWPFKLRNKCDYTFNATALDLELEEELYGQHLAIQVVTEHLNNDNPKKPLVLSFHGPTGSGKSFLSKIIANNLFKRGTRSDFVHFYYGSLDFSNENEKLEVYQKKLMNEIAVFAANCEKSLFIFEEIDKMMPGVVDVIMSFLKLSESHNDVDISKSIFIFLSNTGDKEILDITYDVWFDGFQREDVTLEDFFSHIKEAAYNTKGGLWHSEIVKKNYIDIFVPFLPLEKKHVKQCVIRELQKRKLPYQEDIVEKIASQMQYEPPGLEVYSVSGCKNVPYKVDLFANKEL